MNANLLLSIFVGYLFGSIPFTQLVSRMVKGIDLREVGSRNVGGRNLIRTAGLAWGLVGGAGDVLKGFLAMAFANSQAILAPHIYLVGMAAVAGHNWPVWLRFRGGKGLATAWGAALWLIPTHALISFSLALLVFLFSRNILLTALTSFIALFLTIRFLTPQSDLNAFAAGLFLVVLLASIPDVIHKLTTSGGVAEYMRNPNKVYEEESNKKK